MFRNKRGCDSNEIKLISKLQVTAKTKNASFNEVNRINRDILK